MQIRRNILLGKDEDLSDNKPLRWEKLNAAGAWAKKDV